MRINFLGAGLVCLSWRKRRSPTYVGEVTVHLLVAPSDWKWGSGGEIQDMHEWFGCGPLFLICWA
jgi:hypothetical protein